MGLYRIFPSKDSWITNASIDGTNGNRATGSNFGSSPTLRVFAIKDELTSGSREWGRILLQFDTTELSGKVFTHETVPVTGTQYFLKMFDFKHGDEVPTSYNLEVYPVSRSWSEGTGVDDDNYLDFGFANWLSASSTQTWSVSGSDYLEVGYGSASQNFDRGNEDLEINITSIVNNWLSSSRGLAGLPNNGLLVKLGTAEEGNGTNYDVKIFHGRETKYVDRLPYLEARWNSVRNDNRANFAFNQTSSLYLYNFVRGELTDIKEPVFVRIMDHIKSVSSSFNYSFTASRLETGIYSASVVINNTTSSFSGTWYDIWFSGAVTYMTGTFIPLVLSGAMVDQYDEYVLDVTNLKREYRDSEQQRIKVNARKKNYKTVLRSSASLVSQKEYIEKMYYSVVNNETGEIVVPFGTGSLEYTRLSYNQDGNFFDMDFSSMVPGFTYRLRFLIDINKNDVKYIDDNFVFKVV
jgi:hypothetical protein